MPYYDKSKKKWIGQTRANGRKATKQFQSKKEAKKWELSEKASISTIPTISLFDFATIYLDYSKLKHANITYKEKKSVFKNLLKHIGRNEVVEDVTSGVILGYLQKQTQERSGNAANKERKNLVAAWNYGIKYIEGFPQHNPCYVDRFPETRSPRYVPTEKDFWKVYDQAETEQDSVLLFSYLHLAARRSELFGLKWDDVDFGGQRVRLYTRKRKDGSLEYNWLPMTDDLYTTLLQHRQNAVNEWVFPNPKGGLPYLYRQHWMGRLCESAKVKPFTFHGIRHLTASILIAADVPLIHIQKILRHKNLTTTEKYTHQLKSLRPSLSVIPGRKSPLESPLKKKGLKAISS